MKILIVRMWPDELNINSYNCQEIGLAKALIRKGNTCDIVLYTSKKQNYSDEIIFDNNMKIKIYYLKAKSIFKNAIFDSELYDIIKDYDIVQTAEYDQIGNIKLLKKTKGKMVIYHGPYESEYTKRYKIKCLISDIYFKFHPKYKNVTCLAKSKLAADFLRKKGFKNISTIGVGIDFDRFNNTKQNNSEIEELIQKKNKENLRLLLYIGKIEDRRNIMVLIKILKQALSKNPNIRLVMIGNGKEEYVEQCFNFAKELGVLDKIFYYKSFKQHELSVLYNECDTFLLPTKYEIFGMVMLETMYFGLPIITTVNGGSSMLIKNNETGFICQTYNEEEWCKIIFNILNDKSLRDKISNNGKRLIKEGYTWDILSINFLKEYDKTIKNYYKEIDNG